MASQKYAVLFYGTKIEPIINEDNDIDDIDLDNWIKTNNLIEPMYKSTNQINKYKNKIGYVLINSVNDDFFDYLLIGHTFKYTIESTQFNLNPESFEYDLWNKLLLQKIKELNLKQIGNPSWILTKYID